jgi:hypothetical protein
LAQEPPEVTGAGAAWATPELPTGAGPVLPVLPAGAEPVLPVLPVEPELPELPDGAEPELPLGCGDGVGPLGGPESPRSEGLARGGIFFGVTLARAVEALLGELSVAPAAALFAPSE